MPARSPPAEAFVEQSPPPWRVFDAPSGEQQGAAGKPSAHDRAPAHLGGIPLLAIAAIGAAIVIGGIAVAVALGSGGTAVVSGPIEAAGSRAPEIGSGELVVDVAGAVVTPGVYRLAGGSRIGDAIQAAGGFSPRVDADRVGAELNLAATLTDGQQVHVPSRDDDRVAGGSGGTGTSGGGTGSSIDLNTATQAELESLPGIGPVTAAKIIASRTESPFRTVDELRERGLVGEKTFGTIRALVTVG